MKQRFSFYPLFRVNLIQMMRHGDAKLAIKLAARELRFSRQRRNFNRVSGASGSDGGLIMVPTPVRAFEQKFTSELPPNLEDNQPDGEEDDRPKP